MRERARVARGDLQALSQDFAPPRELPEQLRQQAGPSGLSGIDLGFGAAPSENGGASSTTTPGSPMTRCLRCASKGQVAERESEITSILQSVNDLAQVMRDYLVIDQGTILDRIDYNMTEAATQIEQGVVQLEKAEKHEGFEDVPVHHAARRPVPALMLVLAIKKLG